MAIKVKENAPGGTATPPPANPQPQAAPPPPPAPTPTPAASAPPPPPPPAPAPAPAPTPTPATPAMPKQELSQPKSQGGAVAVPDDLPAHLADVLHTGEGMTPGFENLGDAGLSLPMLRIAQPLTPTVVSGKLRAGDLYLSTDPEKAIIPVGSSADFSIAYHYREWIEWADRESKLGILNRTKNQNSDLVKRWAKQWANRGGPAETKQIGDKTVKVSISEYHVFFIVFEDDREPLAMPCHRTAYKKGKLLMTLARKRGPSVPIWLGKYSVGTVLETNAKGSWYNFDFKTAGWVTPENKLFMAESYRQARDMYESVNLTLDDENQLPDADPADVKDF